MTIPTGHYADITRDARGQWRYRVRSGLELIDTSESYTRRSSALRAVKRNRPDVHLVRIWDRKRERVVRTLRLG